MHSINPGTNSTRTSLSEAASTRGGKAADYTDVLEQLDQVDLMETTMKSLLVEENQQLF
jgi:hypothetical protein